MFIGIPELTDNAHINRLLEMLWNSQSVANNTARRSHMNGVSVTQGWNWRGKSEVRCTVD